MNKDIKQWSTGKANALEELITVTKECDACQIEKCNMRKTVPKSETSDIPFIKRAQKVCI